MGCTVARGGTFSTRGHRGRVAGSTQVGFVESAGGSLERDGVARRLRDHGVHDLTGRGTLQAEATIMALVQRSDFLDMIPAVLLGERAEQRIGRDFRQDAGAEPLMSEGCDRKFAWGVLRSRSASTRTVSGLRRLPFAAAGSRALSGGRTVSMEASRVARSYASKPSSRCSRQTPIRGACR